MAKKGFAVGLDEEVARLDAIGEAGRAAITAALYDGAAVIADAVAAAAQNLPTDTNPGHPFTGPLAAITPEDAADLAAGVGIAHFDDTGDGRSTAVSIEGYTRRTEKGYPNGVPLPMIARSLESGSSVRQKNPFVRRAVSGAQAACEAAMVAAGERVIQQVAGEE